MAKSRTRPIKSPTPGRECSSGEKVQPRGNQAARPANQSVDWTLGIDPGAKTGICLLAGETISELVTVSPEEARLALRRYFESGVRRAAIEHNPSTHIYYRKKTGYREMLKIAQNVAANRCCAEGLISFAEGMGYRVIRVKPYRTKMKPEWFKAETGWAGRTSSHARDAYLTAMRGRLIARTCGDQ